MKHVNQIHTIHYSNYNERYQIILPLLEYFRQLYDLYPESVRTIALGNETAAWFIGRFCDFVVIHIYVYCQSPNFFAIDMVKMYDIVTERI